MGAWNGTVLEQSRYLERFLQVEKRIATKFPVCLLIFICFEVVHLFHECGREARERLEQNKKRTLYPREGHLISCALCAGE